jgi:HTH-type transcriptional regulator/antitoxin HigA
MAKLTEERINAESFPPGDYIREELDVRGWTQQDLAEILGRPPQAVNEIISGKRAITPEMAKGLGDAFGTSAQLWLNLEGSHQLARVSRQDRSVARRARLYEIAPLKDMQRRGWIETSSNVAVLESQVLQFYGINDLDEPIYFQHAAKKSSDYGCVNPPQLAWLYRARHLAHAVSVSGKFSDRSLDVALDRLSKLKVEPEEARHVPRVLAEAGVRFLVLEHLPQTKIDGVCFWLDKESPVIVLSLRYDRIDWFWHTLMHELKHVKAREGMDNPTIDTDLVGTDAQPFETKNESERNADLFAVESLVDQKKLNNFISRMGRWFSTAQIAAFAAKVHTHPGIVVGQLQYRGKIKYTHNRGFLVKVRAILTASSLTDGWGEHMSI